MSYASQLNAAQWLHTERITILMQWAIDKGYKIAQGDAHRDDRCPYGSKSSAHHRSLASDLLLFVVFPQLVEEGEDPEPIAYKYCRDTKDHNALGEKWEKMGGIWGGRFDDGNHYETPFRYDPEKDK